MVQGELLGFLSSVICVVCGPSEAHNLNTHLINGSYKQWPSIIYVSDLNNLCVGMRTAFMSLLRPAGHEASIPVPYLLTCIHTGLQDVKHHPSSVDLELIKRLIATTKATSMVAFLSREFDGISRDYAGVLGHSGA